MRPLSCSFCGADIDRERAVAGPSCVICAVCIGLCADIIADGPAARWLREIGEAEFQSWRVT